MMTLFGEQEGEDVDYALHEKNCDAWNDFIATDHRDIPEGFKGYSDYGGRSLRKPNEHWNTTFRSYHKEQMLLRNGEGFEYSGLPQPDDHVDLKSCEFDKLLCLDGMRFLAGVNLEGSVFLKGLSARNALFEGAVSLEGASVHNGLVLAKSGFAQSFSCERLRYSGDLRVHGNLFSGPTDFSHIQPIENSDPVRPICYFNDNVFSAEARFDFCHFSGLGIFFDCTFKGRAFFSNTRFAKGASFVRSVFEGDSYFVETRFEGGAPPLGSRAEFSEARFERPVTFRNATFKSDMPDFSGTILHPRSTFTAHEKDWAKVPTILKFWKRRPRKAFAQAAESAAFVRHHVQGQGRPEDEHFFFRREMGFATPAKPVLERSLFWVFRTFSDYGNSVERPLRWLILIVAAGFGVLEVYPILNSPEVIANCPASIEHSVSNSLNFFGYLGRYYPECAQGLSPLLKTLSGGQTVLSYTMLFFLGLGLRQRFRLR